MSALIVPGGKRSKTVCLCELCERGRAKNRRIYTPTHRAETPVTESGAA